MQSLPFMRQRCLTARLERSPGMQKVYHARRTNCKTKNTHVSCFGGPIYDVFGTMGDTPFRHRYVLELSEAANRELGLVEWRRGKEDDEHAVSVRFMDDSIWCVKDTFVSE